jgi:RHS repeat-associated protein
MTSYAVSSVPTVKFTGKERDAETGLDYLGARYFSSAQGRWTSPDPKQFNSKFLFNPQKWNKYAYTLNNPLTFVDPDGQEEVTVVLRAFIPQNQVLGFAGDNRTFSTDPNASSRSSIAVRVETDPSVRGSANPILGAPDVEIGASHLVDPDPENKGIASGILPTTMTADGPELPTARASYDENGNTVISISQDVKNPFVVLTRGIRSDLTVTVPKGASSASISGTVSGSPSFEANITVGNNSTENVPIQKSSSNSIVFGLQLQETKTVNKQVDLKKKENQ